MGDFHQNGIVTTLHNLRQRPLEAMEADLMRFQTSRPMGLVLPSLFLNLKDRHVGYCGGTDQSSLSERNRNRVDRASETSIALQ